MIKEKTVSMKPSKTFWYEEPHQVRVLHNKGIVFHEYFVDAASGAAWRIQDVLMAARLIGISEDSAIIEYDDWEDFSGNI